MYLLPMSGSCRGLVRLAGVGFTVRLISIRHRHIVLRLCSWFGRRSSSWQLLLCGQRVLHHSCLLQLWVLLLLLVAPTARLRCIDGA